MVESKETNFIIPVDAGSREVMLMSTKTIIDSKMYENTLHDENNLMRSRFISEYGFLTLGDLQLTVPSTMMALSMVNKLTVFILNPSRAMAESTTVHITIQVVTTT